MWKGYIDIIFKSILDFNQYETMFLSDAALEAVLKKYEVQSATILLADINKKIAAHYLKGSTRLLIRKSVFDSFPSSIQLQFSFWPSSGAYLLVKEVLPQATPQSSDFSSTKSISTETKKQLR